MIEISLDESQLATLQRKLGLLRERGQLDKTIGAALSRTATQGRARADRIVSKKLRVPRKAVRPLLPISIKTAPSDGIAGRIITIRGRGFNMARFPHKEIKGKKRRFPVLVKGQWRTITSNRYGVKFKIPGEGWRTFEKSFLLPTRAKNAGGMQEAAFINEAHAKGNYRALKHATDTAALVGSDGIQELTAYITDRLQKNTRQSINRFYSAVMKGETNGGQ